MEDKASPPPPPPPPFDFKQIPILIVVVGDAMGKSGFV
jgi:hypothetical protein